MVHAASCLCSQVSAECVQQIIQADLALTPAQTQHATTCRFKVFLELKQRQHFLNYHYGTQITSNSHFSQLMV
jgi:hypothetical protein